MPPRKRRRRESGHYLYSGRPKVPRTREEAIRAARELHQNTGREYAIYICDDCPSWHVGTARFKDLRAARRVLARETDTYHEQGGRVVAALWSENRDILGAYHRRYEQRRKTITVRAIRARNLARKRAVAAWEVARSVGS